MGCGGSKAAAAAATQEAKPRPDSEKGPNEMKVSNHPQVSFNGKAYHLSQSFAIVRHGDRLDHTKAWEKFEEKDKYPNDTPLTKDGFKHASETGEQLKKTGINWGLIICSPYLRCAQTASCIAQVLKVPIHFDLDMGEVFDDVSLRGDCKDKPQHRDPQTLLAKLEPDFTDVEWFRDQNGDIKIEGKLQKFPENFDFARMRYAYKTKKLVQKAASELMSIVIVTHGDAVSSVVGMLREEWNITKVNYTAYAVASRQVKVMDVGVGNDLILKDEPVYTNDTNWDIKCSTGLVHKQINTEAKKKQAHEDHLVEMREMEKQARHIHTDYKLNEETEKTFGEALASMGATDDDQEVVMTRAKSAFRENQSVRIVCSPSWKEEEDLSAANDTAEPADDTDSKQIAADDTDSKAILPPTKLWI